MDEANRFMTDDEIKAQRMRIVDADHPHVGEFGYLTGEMISVLGAPMAKFRLDACKHGGDACFVSKGQIEADTFKPRRVTRRARLLKT